MAGLSGGAVGPQCKLPRCLLTAQLLSLPRHFVLTDLKKIACYRILYTDDCNYYFIFLTILCLSNSNIR